MGSFGSMQDELLQARLREFEEQACKGSLVSKARQGRRERSEGTSRRSRSVRLAAALRSAADRLDRPAADCR